MSTQTTKDLLKNGLIDDAIHEALSLKGLDRMMMAVELLDECVDKKYLARGHKVLDFFGADLDEEHVEVILCECLIEGEFWKSKVAVELLNRELNDNEIDIVFTEHMLRGCFKDEETFDMFEFVNDRL